MKDYYKILGLNEGASEAEVKRAYKKAAMQHHPDRGGDENKFKEINEAYDTLKNPSKKKLYEQQRSAPNDGGPFSGSGFHQQHTQNPFGFGFGFKTGGGSQSGNPFDFDDVMRDFDTRFNRRPVRNKDINITYNITIQEAFTGKQATIRATTPTGQEKVIDIDIPAGVEDGIRIRYQGEGMHEHSQLPPGDLYVKIHIQKHPLFERTNSDIRSTIEVDAFKAMSGTEVLFESFDGSTIKVRVPEGTQPGQVLRIPGKGMPHWRQQKSGRGDLYLEVDIHVPKVSELDENVVDVLKRSRIILDSLDK